MVKEVLKKHRKREVLPGLILIIISNFGWMGAITIPFLKFLSTPAKSILVTSFIVAGQILFYLGLFLLGRTITKKIIHKIDLRLIIWGKIKQLFNQH